MYPFYSGARNLDQDDIDGIRSIYPWGWKAVYAQGDPGGGIGGYDCKSGGDKVFAFNYNSSGALDHLVLYRPGTGTVWLLRRSGNSFYTGLPAGRPRGRDWRI